MNFALIGNGSIAEDHARALATLRDRGHPAAPHLRAVVGRRQEPTAAFAHRFGIATAATIADLDAVLADPAIAAVVVASPTDHHADQTARALAAGKHVLCEIPLATSLAETDRLIALAAAADRRLMVCHSQRYQPALAEARRQVASGALTPLSVIARYGFLRRENVNWRGRRRSWTDNLLWHHGAHAVDTALWLLGATGATVAAQLAPPLPPLDIPMDIALALRTETGQIATVALSYNTHLPVHDLLLIGAETTLLAANGTLSDPTGVLIAPTPDDPQETIIRQDADFLTAILESHDPPLSAPAIRPAMAALQAAQDTLAALPPAT